MMSTMMEDGVNVGYWIDRAKEFELKYNSCKEEYDEFQEQSRDLEHELESQLDALEKTNKEFLRTNQQLRIENDNLNTRLQSLRESSSRSIFDLEEKLRRAESFTSTLQQHVRSLEQDNDDLERAKRIAISSLEDFETKLNQAIERNAILEGELDEKQELDIYVQRLKDETRDLKHELAAKSKSSSSTAVANDNARRTSKDKLNIDNKLINYNDVDVINKDIKSTKDTKITAAAKDNKTNKDTEFDKDNAILKREKSRPSKFTINNNNNNSTTTITTTTTTSTTTTTTSNVAILRNGGDDNGSTVSTPVRSGSQSQTSSPLTPAVCISAMNIVTDLLRKFGNIESQFAAFKAMSSRGPPANAPNAASVNAVTSSTGASGSMTSSSTLMRISSDSGVLSESGSYNKENVATGARRTKATIKPKILIK